MLAGGFMRPILEKMNENGRCPRSGQKKVALARAWLGIDIRCRARLSGRKIAGTQFAK
jgi:hypothetical protein